MLLQPYHFPDIAAKFLDPEEDNGIEEDIDDIDVEVEGPNRPSDIELEEALDHISNIFPVSFRVWDIKIWLYSKH